MSNESRGRFDSKTTHYLRPDRPYVCGRSGSPCSNGPTSAGACPHGEVRCEPRINEGHLRKKVHRWVLLLFLGGFMVTLASADEDGKPFQQKLIRPGPLSHVHARFDCKDCHSEEINSWSALFASAWHGGKDTVGSEGCLECHQQGEHAKYAHGVSPKELRSRSSYNDVEPFEDQTECTVCHSEHGHGNSQQILSDSRCQACHQQNYDSFRSGHPEFSESYGFRFNLVRALAQMEHPDAVEFLTELQQQLDGQLHYQLQSALDAHAMLLLMCSRFAGNASSATSSASTATS